jgi:4-hydroxy-3-methylbut-2-en-1-yl diphosphate synthase IspG/GcpE
MTMTDTADARDRAAVHRARRGGSEMVRVTVNARSRRRGDRAHARCRDGALIGDFHNGTSC